MCAILQARELVGDDAAKRTLDRSTLKHVGMHPKEPRAENYQHELAQLIRTLLAGLKEKK
jgi:hypothetical protein